MISRWIYHFKVLQKELPNKIFLSKFTYLPTSVCIFFIIVDTWQISSYLTNYFIMRSQRCIICKSQKQVTYCQDKHFVYRFVVFSAQIRDNLVRKESFRWQFWENDIRNKLLTWFWNYWLLVLKFISLLFTMNNSISSLQNDVVDRFHTSFWYFYYWL